MQKDKTNYILDWSDIVFSNSKKLGLNKSIVIAPSREFSNSRFISIIKDYLKSGNLVLVISKENYILGFEDQPHFKTLNIDGLEETINKVNESSSTNKIYIVNIFQRDFTYLIDKLNPSRVLLVNGSWKYSFQNTDIFYNLVKESIPYKLVSPFIDEVEAKEYEQYKKPEIKKYVDELVLEFKNLKGYTEKESLELANIYSVYSYDHTYQTGLVLGRKISHSNNYKYLTHSFNRIVPYETYALLNGASREINFSPTNDLNFYDTNHAEAELLVKSLVEKIDLKNTTLFINLMPCPTCARMISRTQISEIVYNLDHSDGYAVNILSSAGKIVRRVTF